MTSATSEALTPALSAGLQYWMTCIGSLLPSLKHGLCRQVGKDVMLALPSLLMRTRTFAFVQLLYTKMAYHDCRDLPLGTVIVTVKPSEPSWMTGTAWAAHNRTPKTWGCMGSALAASA